MTEPTTTAMPFRRAAALAVEALKRQRHTFAPEAHMFFAGIVSYATERAAKRYAELTQAIETLEELGKARIE